MSGTTAINVAKLQEQLAKNITIYNTGAGVGSNVGSGNNQNGQTSTADNNDSVSKFK